MLAALGGGAGKSECRLPEKRGGAFELGCWAYRYRWMRAETKKMPLPTVVCVSTRLRRELCSQMLLSVSQNGVVMQVESSGLRGRG